MQRFNIWTVLIRINILFICFIYLCSSVIVFAVGELFFTQTFLDQVRQQHGETTLNRVIAWHAMLEDADGRLENTKLIQVNAFFNQIPNKSDNAVWGTGDYWATPVELLAANAGDCDDFAIAKYFSLRMLGFSEDRLRLAYVRHYGVGKTLKVTPHLVLIYYDTAGTDPWVLDNLIPEIKPASQRRDLVAVYTFNASGMWRAQERNQGRQIAVESGRFSKWENMLERMKNYASRPFWKGAS